MLRKPLLASLAALTIPFAAHTAHALTWDASGTSPTAPAEGSGTWSASAANWSNGISDVVWPAGSDASFGNGGSGNASVTTAGPISAGLLTFNPGATYTIHIDDADRLTLAGGISVAPNVSATFVGTAAAATSTYDMILSANQTWNVGDNATLTFDARFDTTADPKKSTLTKSGNGTLLFEGSNGGSHDVEAVTYNLNAGIIRIANTAGALGFTGNSLNVASGASLEITTASLSLGNSGSSITLSGMGVNGEGAITVIGPGSHVIGSPASGVATFNLISASTGIGANDPAGNFIFQQILGGAGGLTKVGPGTLTLADADTFSGGTLVSTGTLVLGNVTAAGTGSIAVADGATLQIGPALSAAPKLPAVTLSNGSLAPAATLDLAGQKLVIEPAASKATVLTTLQAQTAYGAAFGTGIISSGMPANFGIAIIDNAITNFSTFGNQTVDANSLLLSPELLGDTNIDGKVDLTDLSTVLNNFGKANLAWTSGNFDHTPTIDLTDLSDVLNNFGVTNANPNALQSASPPPPPQNPPLFHCCFR